MSGRNAPVVFWHRELPPLHADVVSGHVLEADSDRVTARYSQRDEIWAQCAESLRAHARERLQQEVTRLGGDYAHVLDEMIETRRHDPEDEAWLHGRYSWVLYRDTGAARAA